MDFFLFFPASYGNKRYKYAHLFVDDFAVH
uniref:Uncharacterized protein n=1 Tax=Arundo donax TaxID=35708 RepID=A0A0A8YU19_ARUDO